MAGSKAELIIHPVRIRIVHAVLARELTSRQIAEQMPDVPQATLYRQIKLLLDGGLLHQVSERRVNGIVERTYTMPAGSAHLTRSEFATITPEEHARFFAIFCSGLSGALDRYTRQERFDVVRDGMTYFQARPNLTDDEARQLRLDMLALVERYGRRPDAPGRRRRMVGVALIPEAPIENSKQTDGNEE